MVPGVGPTYCEDWCYQREGYVLNHTGGRMAFDTTRDWTLQNEIISPPIPWQAGLGQAELAFDVYRHQRFGTDMPNIFHRWGVRSTTSSDPADLDIGSWHDWNFFYEGGPDYNRQVENIGPLIEPDAQWVQVRLSVETFAPYYGTSGTNGTPAPYFDNVAVKGWPGGGPSVAVTESFAFADAYPEQGFLDPGDPASNWCRIDSAVNIAYYYDAIAPGDSPWSRRSGLLAPAPH